MQVTGIIKNKARVLSKVVYLDVAETANPDGPKKQWVLFKDKHTHKDIQAVTNAEPGSSIIIDGKDNVNKQTGQSQIVINSLLNIIPTDASLTSSTNILQDELLNPFPMEATANAWNALNDLMRHMPKQQAIGMLAKMISLLNGGN